MVGFRFLSLLSGQPSYCQDSKQNKLEQQKQYSIEEQQFLMKSKEKLLDYISETKDQLEQENQQFNEIKSKYQKNAKMKKYKYGVKHREERRSLGEVSKFTGKYAITYLFLKTNDQILYKYKRRLQREVQWDIIKKQYIPVFTGALVYFLTRNLKSKSPSDVFYFFLPFIFTNYGLYLRIQHKLFEISYPPHPHIFENRAQVIYQISYYYPKIIKNEIEFLHSKLKQLSENQISERYEREFENKKQKKFKVVVEDGQIFMKCIDSFPSIFELQLSDIQALGDNLEITDILDPSLFDSHNDVVLALFEVYYDLAAKYCKEGYYKTLNVKEGEKFDPILKKAANKIRKKYKLDQELENLKQTEDLINNLKK